MKQMKKKNKGITLVALIITIIILLILAGISIATLTHDGLFEKAKSATREYKISEYLEKIELARLSVQQSNQGKITIESLVDEIYKDKVVSEGSITIVDEYAIMTTPEGYNFLITETDAKYVEGNKDEILPPVTSIEIETEKTELKVGEKTTLTATINPEKAYNKNIEWISEDTDIIEIGTSITKEDETVSVEIIAKSSGITNIIAKSTHGKNKEEVTATCTIKVKKPVNYGTSIQNNYGTLYTTDYPNGYYVESDMQAYGNGNYIRAHTLTGCQTEKQINGGTKQPDDNHYSYIYSGNNTNIFEEAISSRWISLRFRAGGLTTGVSLSNLKLNFSDNTICTVREAVAKEYIEPLIICESNGKNGYIWTNVMNVLDGGSTSTSDYPELRIMFKVKEKSTIKGITFYTNQNWSTTYDGLAVYKHREGFEISTTPLD